MPMQAWPKDRTKTEHVARVRREVFRNADTNFVILDLFDDLTAMGSADIAGFINGITYRFLGKWEDDPQRGPRFRFSTYTEHAVHGRSGCVKYLCDLCEGIGPSTAGKLWDKYLSDVVDILRDDPRRVASELALNLDMCIEAAEVLGRHKKYQHTKIDLNGIFTGRGFTGKLIDACIDRWGVRAAEMIRKNPFRLLDMPSAGFKRCDKLYLDMGHRPDALKRQAICAVEAIRRDRAGHTWLGAEHVAQNLKDMIPAANPVAAFKLALRARMLAKYRDGDNRLWLTTGGRAMAERMIAAHVQRLGSNEVVLWPTGMIRGSTVEGDGLPSAHQLEHLNRATAGAVGLFCGSPGTGKTHTLAYLLKEIIVEFGTSAVCVVAPTGKAAVRAKQALKTAGVDLPTSTIHSALIQCGSMNLSGDDGEDMDGFGGEQDGYLDCRFLIVDEASMIDSNLMAVLLASCMMGTHVLFVGDPHQLPPVGHGSPLRDMIAAGLPYGELTHVRRNAGQIVHACLRVKNGEEFETTERIDLEASPPANLRLITARDDKEQVEVLEAVLRAMKQFHPVWGCQVIVARNKGGLITRKELNERLQGVLNPDGHTVTSNPVTSNPFRIGDKIICLKNCKQHVVGLYAAFSEGSREALDAASYETVYKSMDECQGGHREPQEAYLANGEIGRVVAVAAKVTIARFSEADCVVRIPMGGKTADEKRGDGGEADEQGRGCNFDLAYAVTCHKLQGSSAPCVIVMGDAQGGGVTGREWLYTAISRAAKVCLMIGGKGVFMKMVARVSTTKRKTFLAEQLAEVLGHGESNEPLLTQQAVKGGNGE